MKASNRVTHICAAAIVALLVGACGSSSGGQTSSSGGSSSAYSTSTSGSASSSGGSGTVDVISVSGYGKVLGTSSGKALYILTTDGTNSSKCDASCAQIWPPLTVTGKPTAGSGLDSSKLAVFKRSDGTEQVSYDGHPLYTYTGPTAASGEGLHSFGGVWWLVDSSGKAVKKQTSNHGY